MDDAVCQDDELQNQVMGLFLRNHEQRSCTANLWE